MELLRNVKNIGGGGNPSLTLDLTRFRGVLESDKKNKSSFFSAFTLAEMMVVMLILSIILAAMAPVITTRDKPNYSTPWKYDISVNPSLRNDIWFGTGARQHVMIGQERFLATDPDAKLLINVNNGTSRFLGFKRNGQEIGGLYLNNDGGIMLGSINGILATNSNAIGRKVEASQANATAYGSEAKANGANSVAVGTSVTAGGSDSFAIGSSSSASDDFSIALGSNVTASDVGAIAVGHHALVYGIGSIAIGAGDDDLPTLAGYHRDVVIGANSSTKRTSDSALTGSSIAIGGEATAYDATSIAIGPRTTSYSKSIAIGDKATISQGALSNNFTYSSGSIAIGQSSSAKTEYKIEEFKTKQTRFVHAETNSIALGSGAAAEGGGIAIGSPILGYISTRSDSYDPEKRTNLHTSAKEGGVALGNGAISLKEHAIAIGTNATVKASGSIAIGNSAEASLAPGVDSDPVEAGSIAIGAHAKATMDVLKKAEKLYKLNSIAIGNNALAEYGSIAIGPFYKEGSKTNNTEASSIGSIAIGCGAKAISLNAIAIGKGASASGTNSVAIGTDIENARSNVIQLGNKTQSVYIPGDLIVGGSTYLGVDIPGHSFAHFAPLYVQVGRYLGDGNYGLHQIKTRSENWGTHSDELYLRYELNETPNPLATTTSSDRRLKYVGKENTSGLDKIRQLKVFNYTFKKDAKKEPHVGVIAQDLQKIFPNAVKKGADGFLTIRMEDMFYAVINAIKELDAKYQAQEKRINELEKRIEKLEAKVK